MNGRSFDYVYQQGDDPNKVTFNLIFLSQSIVLRKDFIVCVIWNTVSRS